MILGIRQEREKMAMKDVMRKDGMGTIGKKRPYDGSGRKYVQ